MLKHLRIVQLTYSLLQGTASLYSREREFSLEFSSSSLLHIFQKKRFRRPFLFSITGFFRFDSRWFGLLALGSGGFLNAVFASFCLREGVIPFHFLRRPPPGFFPIPFDLRSLSSSVSTASRSNI